MASDEQMRDQIKRAYPGSTWIARVDKMSKTQVAAVYQRLLNQKKL